MSFVTEPDTPWYEPVLAFGAEVQRGIGGGKTFADLSYENQKAWQDAGAGLGKTSYENQKAWQDFGTSVVEGFTTNITEPAVGAGKSLTEFSENLQKFSYNLQQGSSEFFKSGGTFLDRLSGGQGLFPQLGAALPFLAIGLIALVLLVRR